MVIILGAINQNKMENVRRNLQPTLLSQPIKSKRAYKMVEQQILHFCLFWIVILFKGKFWFFSFSFFLLWCWWRGVGGGAADRGYVGVLVVILVVVVVVVGVMLIL